MLCAGLLTATADADPPGGLSRFAEEFNEHIERIQLAPPRNGDPDDSEMIERMVEIAHVLEFAVGDRLRELPRAKLIREPDQRDEVLEHAARIQPWIEDFEECSRLVQPLVHGPGYESELEGLDEARWIARAIMAFAIDAWLNGDEESALLYFERCGLLASASSRRGLSVSPIIGFFIDRLCAETAIAIAVDERSSRELVLSLLAQIRASPPLVAYSDVVESERLWLLDLMRWLHTDEGIVHVERLDAVANGSPRRVDSIEGSLSPIGRAVGEVLPRFADTERLVSQYFAEVQEYISLPPAARKDSKLARAPIDDPRFAGNGVMSVLTPPFQGFYRLHLVRERELLSLELALATEAARRRLGRLPRSQDEMVGHELSWVLSDPRSGDPLPVVDPIPLLE